MNYFIKHFSYTLVLVASLLISSVSFSEEAKPQFVKDYESGYGKYFQVRSEAREKISLRSIASDDPNAPIKKDEAMEGFKKYLVLQKEKQKRRENFDLDKDGKTDCKRRFYPNSSQIKTEVCDFNHDGVVDLKTKYNKDGLAVLELTNFDKDKFFEKKVSCKTITPDKEVARCVTETALDGSNTRTLSTTEYMSDFNQALKNRRRKRDGRSVASVSGGKDRFDDSKLPSLDFEEQRASNDLEIARLNGDKVLFNKYKNKLNHLKMMRENSWKIDQGDGTLVDQTFMKYFASFKTYIPGEFDSCLSASRDCCQSGVDYKKMGSEGDFGDYQHCLNYSFHWCSDNGRSLPENVNWCDEKRSKVEGNLAPCFECMAKDLYEDMTKMLDPHFMEIYNEAKKESPPKGFFSPRYSQLWIHESCKEYFKDSDPVIDYGDRACFKDLKDKTSVQSNITRMRMARYTEPNFYSYYAKLKNKELGKNIFNEDKYLENWKAKKDLIDKICELDERCDYLDEDSPRLKVFCADLNGVLESATNPADTPIPYHFNSESIFSPPFIVMNVEDVFREDYKLSKKLLFSKFKEDGDFSHALHHTMGHTHPLAKRLKNGKYRCGWGIEPDYAALCSPNYCEDFKSASKGKVWCGMNPTDHLTDDGDLTKEYMDTMYKVYFKHKMWDRERVFGLVNKIEDCRVN